MAGTRAPAPQGDDPFAPVPRDGPGPGRFFFTGPLNDEGAAELQSGAKGQKGGGGSTGSVEFTVIANFEYPWPGEAAEVKQLVDDAPKPLTDKKWSPSLKDFQTIASLRKSAPQFIVHNFGEFIGAILAQPKASIKQINVITHSNPGLISFGSKSGVKLIDIATGQVSLGKSGGTSNPLDGSLDVDALQGLAPLLESKTGQPILKEIASRFASKSSIITFYACHGGMGQGFLLMQDLADAFQVTVEAFADAVAYCPTFDAAKGIVVDRTITGLKDCHATAAGFFAWHKPPGTGRRFPPK